MNPIEDAARSVAEADDEAYASQLAYHLSLRKGEPIFLEHMRAKFDAATERVENEYLRMVAQPEEGPDSG